MAFTRTLLLSAALVALAACGGNPSTGTGGGTGGDTGTGGSATGGSATGGGTGGSATGGGTGGSATGGGTGGSATGGGTGGSATGGGTGGSATGGGTGGSATGGGTGGSATGGGTGGGAGCVDTCTATVSICDGNDVRVCQLDAITGCRTFAPKQTCTGGTTCSGGVCQASCTNQCTLGAKQCASTGAPVECQTLPNSCTDWVLQATCTGGKVCSGGSCVVPASCTDQCTLGQTRCTTGGLQQTCVQFPGGCTDWSLPIACTSGQTCASGTSSCSTAKCTSGAKRCSTSTPAVETCDANGNWYTTSLCPQACSNGACTASASCNAGTVRCNGTNIEICNATGTAWLYNQTCPVSCTKGICTGACSAGTKRCNGAVPEVCNGAGWDAGTSCMYECYNGDCTQNDLVIDGTTVTLEGDLKYSNSVTIKNSGQLRVGPSGTLKIRTKTLTVDSNTTINANDLGVDTRGEGNDTYAGCYYGSCYISGAVQLGSSYGTMGAGYTGTTVSTYCSAYGGTRSCSTSSISAPSVYDRDDDLSISQGSKWNTPNKGGGLVQIIADTATINGQITANSTGTGASGGGVLIAANTLGGTGVIQTAGAATSPTGGNGRVKLLRGTTNGFYSGAITGNNRASPMPPLDLVSGSHPDQARWYNDGLGDWFLAWSKPYPTLVGYYWKLSTDPNTLPSNVSGNGTLIQAETIQVPAAQLVQGKNYVHVVSVDSAFNVGTVKATATVQVNTVPPTIASASHPSQRTWGGSSGLYFNWTNPQADSNFTGYYFVLDHFADTIPAATPNNFTSNKQVLLANTPDGVWGFHVLNADTRGATTKTASHYIVYVGANPGTGNLSGSVYDGTAGNAALSGVNISINRGMFGQTTVTNGTYTFGGTLPGGTWEVTASKAGYLPQTVTIATPTDGGVVNQNFTLTK